MIGEVGRPEHVEEDRVEVLVLARAPKDLDSGSSSDRDAEGGGVEMRAVLQELKKVRPESLHLPRVTKGRGGKRVEEGRGRRRGAGARASECRTPFDAVQVHPYEEVAYDVYRLEDF